MVTRRVWGRWFAGLVLALAANGVSARDGGLDGVWVQLGVDPASGAQMPLCTVRVQSTGTGLEMNVVDIGIGRTEWSNPFPIGDSRVEGDRWSFASRPQPGLEIRFELQRTGPHELCGEGVLSDGRRERQIWRRVNPAAIPGIIRQSIERLKGEEKVLQEQIGMLERMVRDNEFEAQRKRANGELGALNSVFMIQSFAQRQRLEVLRNETQLRIIRLRSALSRSGIGMD